MKSLFEATENASIAARLRALPADGKPIWGSMTPAQTLAHCSEPMLRALGDVASRRGPLSYLLGWFVKRLVLKPEPFKQNLPTDKDFLVPGASDVEAERQKTLALVERCAAGPTCLSGAPHPFFGQLDDDQWGFLMWKHLDHHLRQFGV